MQVNVLGPRTKEGCEASTQSFAEMLVNVVLWGRIKTRRVDALYEGPLWRRLSSFAQHGHPGAVLVQIGVANGGA